MGVRYRKNFFLNRRKARALGLDQRPIKTESHDQCPVCGSPSGTLISEVDRVGFPCDTVICDGCQLVFNDTYIVDPVTFYSQEWGVERWGDPEDNFVKRTSSDSYAWKRMAHVAKLLDTQFPELNNVLEVGCGDGCNLFPYHLIGKEVMGCDFDSRYLSPGRQRGMNLIEGDLYGIPKENPFDLVMLIHSFEHMMDLDVCVQEIYQHVGAGGYVYVEVPGILNMNRPRRQSKQAMGMKSGVNILGYLQFQHNYHFDLTHIVRVWERNGFELVSGDEWVRALFRKVDACEGSEKPVPQQRPNEVFDHLASVEKDVYSLKTLVSILTKKILH